MKNFNFLSNKHSRFIAALCLLLSFGIGNAWGDSTITLGRSNVAGKTSYSTTEQTFTQSSVSFGYINLMENGANGTPTNWAKEQVMQTKNGGYLYNKGSLSIIKTVKIWIVANDNGFSVGYGDSEKPTTNKIAKSSATKTTPSITYTKYANKTTTPNQTTTANTYEFDLSSYNATYFCIIPTGSLYIWKVEITYGPAGSTKTLVLVDIGQIAHKDL